MSGVLALLQLDGSPLDPTVLDRMAWMRGATSSTPFAPEGNRIRQKMPRTPN